MRGSRTFVAAVACTSLLSSFPTGDEGRGAAQAQSSAPSPAPTATPLIDRELAASWRAAGITPAPLSSDHQYIRRVTLDLAGRIPSVGEVEAFVADRAADKRARLVDRLLASPDHADHLADRYLDLLVGRELRYRPVFGDSPRAYFVDAFATNKPFDQLVTELIAAEGALDESGAASFIIGQQFRGGTIEQLADATARTFLGVRIGCAQCHDHPFDDRYEQEDFTRFAAYFAGTRPRAFNDPLLGRTIEVIDRHLPYQLPARVVERRRDRFPYVITPAFLGRETPPTASESRRELLARAIVGSELFAKVTVNRTWHDLFGRGLVDPWDDLGAADDPKHPPLLDRLAADFAASGFDHRRLVRSIVLSSAYQRASAGGRGDDLEDRFARARVRQLTAGQLFYAQLLATGAEEAVRRDRPLLADRQIDQVLRQYLFTFADDEGADTDSFTGSVPQALLVRNGGLTNQGTRAISGGVLDRILRASSDRDQRLDWLFLTAYSRPPSDRERRELHRFLDGAEDRAAYEDLFHALITSTEFMTNH